ncbi:uncharacterized protein DNG_02583 [Cephalotrichum gorgonifer]|uniref:Histidine acid phosphatase n=1 Tax=Cephalotrichum gorgonifer TaxID=2041049 RepID=A0AAE8MTU4_9PEZI|nr:uncharacterized protein DNG_02583 [Cephalotrichum gorgonifer]
MIAKLGLALSGLLAPAVAETIHGVAVYSRHGDRNTKHYGAQALTSVGFEECYQVGGQYRARYLSADSPHRILGISESKYVSSQIFASAPDSGILWGTATAFLQGFYPPLDQTDPDLLTTKLNNGSEASNPIGGYQYVLVHGEDDDAPDAIWIKGDQSCPANKAAKATFKDSAFFKQRDEETKSFYAGFKDALSEVYDYTSPSNFSYANAFDIFDLINVARIHNASSPALDVSDEDLAQLRTLADSAEFESNYNASQPDRSIHGRTLIAGLLNQLNSTVTSQGKVKFSLLAGSYNTMLAFFGLTGLSEVSTDFKGVPGYSSTISFELFTEEDLEAFPDNTDDLRVRFLFRNGTTGQPTAFPLFGKGKDSLSWPEFVDEMSGLELGSAEAWCGACKSDLPFCAAYSGNSVSGQSTGIKGGMSKEVKGGIAMITIGSAALLSGALFFMLAARKMRSHRAAVAAGVGAAAEKGSIHSGSTDSRV